MGRAYIHGSHRDIFSQALGIRNKLRIIKLLLQHGELPLPDNAVRFAAADNDMAVLELFVNHGFNIQVYGHYPSSMQS
ncbi:hypothetical protein BDW59DRAFT_153901 [Aspergillus cavernicola]|uniref:Ankyrin repeat-containing domain protein n=1 Tax=Aspergillus cavernicola TaxID=176166 RepID=A0ABR4HJ14_9EURO